MKRIDSHVHPRPDIETVARLAKEQGIAAILVMPENPTALLWEKDLKVKLLEAQKKRLPVKYFFYVGLTSGRDQIKEAVRLAKNYPQVIGLKLYSPENEKKKVYKTLAEFGYRGVLAVHAEKASLFKPQLFNSKKPWTHNLAQPPCAETESIKEQIKFAVETKFSGILYILHMTLPESAKIICQVKKQIRIYSEATPHHLLLSAEDMHCPLGLSLKVNPPLRKKEDSRGLVEAVKNGMVDCLGTDFAYYPMEKKFSPPYSSGIACYGLYGAAIDLLRGEGVSEKGIKELTCSNIKKIFGDKLKDV